MQVTKTQIKLGAKGKLLASANERVREILRHGWGQTQASLSLSPSLEALVFFDPEVTYCNSVQASQANTGPALSQRTLGERCTFQEAIP